jgi:iron complex outermembrane receptor protein
MNRWATRALIFLVITLTAPSVFGQEEEAEADTTLLEELVVKAYQSNRPSYEVPAAIGIVDGVLMNRFANTSFVSAANTIPGVRMEERSPGSYRFSIRGSLLRSPFGVRNVKFYWRGLPFTDGGGNTYLNLLDFTSVHSMEIIKGPGSSLYGAGTGGAVLMEPNRRPVVGLNRTSLLGGSYGLWQLQGVYVAAPSQKANNTINILGGLQGSQGYRDQTSMSRFNAAIELNHFEETSTTNFVLFSGQLSYETPGGLTRAQFEDNPRQARPATPAGVPGAVEQKASIRNNTVYSALSNEKDWNERWSSNTGVFASYTDFKNPAILNYEQRGEINVGTRIAIDYRFGSEFRHKLTFGAEGQYFMSNVNVSTNDQGNIGVLMTKDELKSRSAFGFVQGDFRLPMDFLLTVGGSANFLNYDMERTFPTEDFQIRNFKPGFFPRVAILKRLYETISLYATASNGFSAPSFAEVLPNTGIYNQDLNPERGTNFAGGVKADFFKRLVHAEFALYDFRITDAIVNVAGGDDYQNAGETSQRGLELTLSGMKQMGRVSLRHWGTYAYNNYYFRNYVRAGSDYSGNELTGVPRHVIVGGLDVLTKRGWYINLTANHTERIPLNDGNTEYAEEYFLLGARGGKKIEWRGLNADLYGGVDNVLDQDYSLGNDLNALGGRYYNAAPGRNYFFGVAFSPLRQ